MGLFDDLFGWVGDLVDSVVDIVGDAVSAITGWLDDAIDWISDHLDIVMIGLAVGAGLVCWVVIPELTAIAASLESGLVSVEWASLSWVSQAYVTLTTYAASISAAFSSFLTAIHFETILAINDIAFLVSEDYRQMMTGVFSEISEVSAALGFVPQFLALAIQNTRTVVLDVSSMLGMTYDLSQVQWLQTFQGYLKQFNDRAETYKNNPAKLFDDLGQLVEKPFIDTKAHYMRDVIKTIDSTIHAIDGAVRAIVKVRDDLDKLVADLPESIRKEVKPYTDKLTQQFDDFLSDVYYPKLSDINGILNILSNTQSEAQKKIGSILDRIKNPGRYLREIDSMSETERTATEEYLNDVVSRPMQADTEAIVSVSGEIEEGLKKLSELLGKRYPAPAYEIPEITAPSRPAGAPATPRETWNVGDF